MPFHPRQALKIDIDKIINLASERLQPHPPENPEEKATAIQTLTPTLFSLNHQSPHLQMKDFIENTLLQAQIKNIIVIRDLDPLNGNMNFWLELCSLRIGKFLGFEDYQLIAEKPKHTYKLKNLKTGEEKTFALHFFSCNAFEMDIETPSRLLNLYKKSLQDEENLLIDSLKKDDANSLALSFLVFELLFYFNDLHPHTTKAYKRIKTGDEEKKALLSNTAEDLIVADIVKIVQSLRVNQPALLNKKDELNTIISQASLLLHYAIIEGTHFRTSYPHLCHFAAFQSFFHRLAYRFFYPAPNPVPPPPVDNEEDDIAQQSFWRCC